MEKVKSLDWSERYKLGSSGQSEVSTINWGHLPKVTEVSTINWGHLAQVMRKKVTFAQADAQKGVIWQKPKIQSGIILTKPISCGQIDEQKAIFRTKVVTRKWKQLLAISHPVGHQRRIRGKNGMKNSI